MKPEIHNPGNQAPIDRGEAAPLRCIYQKGQRIGPDPRGGYLYLWRGCGGTDRYLGVGTNGRWKAHLLPDPSNWAKSRYFIEHRMRMACFIITEGWPSSYALRNRERFEIAARGFQRTGTGTLLNAREYLLEARFLCCTGRHGRLRCLTCSKPLVWRRKSRETMTRGSRHDC